VKYWFGPFVKDTKLTRFCSPDNTIGTLDLRSYSSFQDSDLNGALFWTMDDIDLGNQYSFLGQGNILTLEPTSKAKNSLPFEVSGNTLSDWVWSILTVNSDPFGKVGPKPIIPTKELTLDLHLQGHGNIKSKLFNLEMPEAPKVLTVLQENYRKIRQEILNGEPLDPQLHQKMLDFWGEQFNVHNPEEIFIPEDLPRETRVKHTTSLSDNFNRANQTPLGTASGGGTWNSYLGDPADLNDTTLETTFMSIISNELGCASTSATWTLTRLESDLSSSNHSAQFSVAVFGQINNQWGTTVRRALSTDGTCYWGRVVPVLGKVQFTKSNSHGYPTDIATSVASPVITGLPKILKTTINGSTYTVTWDGTDMLTGTDTSISSGTRTGTFCYFPTTADLRADDWSASDIENGWGKLFSNSRNRLIMVQ